MAGEFFSAVVTHGRTENLLLDEHFTVDGTLIEAYASLKSFTATGKKIRKDDDNPLNSSVDFHGEKRNNAKHTSTTDSDARLMPQEDGKVPKLSYLSNALTENRNGLCVDLAVLKAEGNFERAAALAILDRQI